MSPTFGGKPVTHEEYLHLDAANSRKSPPSEEMLSYARHLDVGCPVSTDLGEQLDRLQVERDKLEELRQLYALNLLKLIQKTDEWAFADDRVASGLDALETPTVPERLALLIGALRTIDRRGHAKWKR
jgi:hypothetical protein